MRIGIDLDGVCYDFTGAYLANQAPPPPGFVADKWEFYKDLGQTTEQFLDQCCRMIRVGLLFARGDLLPGTKEAFRALRERGHTIHIVTDRCSLDPDDAGLIIKATKAWLLENDLDYQTIHFSGEKAEVAKELRLDFFLDDKMENCEALWDADIEAYIFDQPWNQCEPGRDCPRVYSWNEFVKVVDMATAEVMTKEQMLEEIRVTSETGGQKGQKLARLGSLDPGALLKVAEVAGFGEQKYSRLNYMNGYDWSLTFDAGMRHRLAFWNGEDLDPESGLPHLAHAAWHDLCLLAFFMRNLGTDDRYRPESLTDHQMMKLFGLDGDVA